MKYSNLLNYLTKNRENILEAAKKKSKPSIALFPGKFKPPHVGHLEAVKESLKKASKVIVIISQGTVEGEDGTQWTPERSLQIWEKLIKQSAIDSSKVDVRISKEKSPVLEVYKFLANSPEIKGKDLFVVKSSKDDAEGDKRFKPEALQKSLSKNPNGSDTEVIEYKIDPKSIKGNVVSSSDIRALSKEERKAINPLYENSIWRSIFEGGNKAGTGPIKKESIDPTLASFSKEIKRVLKVPFSYSTLGSVGHKPESGDIDLSLDISEFISKEGKVNSGSIINQKDLTDRFEKLKARAKTSSDGKLITKALTQLMWEKLDSDETTTEYLVDEDVGKVGQTIFFKYPKNDGTGNVQIDLNVGNQKWLNFAYYSSPDIYSKDFQDKYGKLKGLHRTQLLLAMFSVAGYTFDHSTGVINKETKEVEGTTPEEAINLINKKFPKLKMSISDVDNYASLMSKVNSLDEKNKDAILQSYLKILHSPGYEDIEKPKDLFDYIKKHGIKQEIRKSRQ